MDVKRKLILDKKWEDEKSILINTYNKVKDKKHIQACKLLKTINKTTKQQVIKRYYKNIVKIYISNFSRWFRRVNGIIKDLGKTTELRTMNQEDDKQPIFVYCPEPKDFDHLILRSVNIVM